MSHPYRIGQADLARIYEQAQARMSANQEFAKEKAKIIQNTPSFKSEKEALIAAIALEKKTSTGSQIWAKIEKVDDIYRITDFWLVTDEGGVKLAAEYIGMALMYDNTRILNIIDEHVNIDDVIAYW